MRELLPDFSAFSRVTLISSGLSCIFFKFALPFFLVLFLLREFLLTLLKTKIRFSHVKPPQEKMYELSRILIRVGPTGGQPAVLQ